MIHAQSANLLSTDRRDHRLRIFLALFLLSFYLLVYVNTPDSADGKAMLATASSFVQFGRVDMDVINVSDSFLPDLARLGNRGIDGALYSKKGPVVSIALLPLVLAAKVVPWLPIRATAMLFNPLITVFTAVILYTFIRWMDYRPRTALALGLIFGTATLSVPYVKTLFGEPLAGLLILIGVTGAYRFQRDNDTRFLIIAGTTFALLLGINLVYGLLLPFVAIYLFWGKKIEPRNLIRFAIPLVLVGGFLGLYNWARFGNPVSSGYHFGAGEGFIHPLWAGLYGLFFSPYRGFFPYNPILLLSIPGWLILRRVNSRLAWLSLGLILAQGIGFASWWSWHGGIVWGPRFLLPAIPLAVLFLAPLVEAAWNKPLLLITGIGFTALSIGVQLLGALYSYFPYMGYLYAHYEIDTIYSLASGLSDQVVYDPLLSPILGHLALFMAGWRLEPSWIAIGINPVHAAASLLLLVIAFLTLFLKRGTLIIAVIAGLISLNVVATGVQQLEPYRYGDIETLQKVLQPPGLVLAATSLYDDALIDVENGARVITMNAPTQPDDEAVKQVWEYTLEQAEGSPFWYVTIFAPADPNNWQEQWLWQNASYVRQEWVGSHRAIRFDLRPAPSPDQTGGWIFGDSLRLDSYGIQRTPDGVFVSLQWSTNAPLTSDFSFFMHLLDTNGQIITQQDRPLWGGYMPTSAIKPGEPIVDRLFFPAATGTQIRIGVVDATGTPLEVRSPDGQQQGFVLLPY